MEIDKLLENVKTKKEAEILLEEIDAIYQGLYGVGEGVMENILKNKVRANTAKVIREIFTQAELDRKGFLDQAKIALTKMPNISLILAFEPAEGAIERFYSKISEYSGSRVLLDVVYEPEIIGGAVVIFNGEYRDFSFKKIFEAEFERSRHTLLAVIEQRKVKPVRQN